MKQLFSLGGCGVVELVGADPSRHQAPIHPRLALWIGGGWRAFGEFSASALDPTVVVFLCPSPSVTCLVLGCAAHRLFGLAHLGRVDQVLQRLAAKAKVALALGRQR
jgi:hypothetical protein